MHFCRFLSAVCLAGLVLFGGTGCSGYGGKKGDHQDKDRPKAPKKTNSAA